MIKNKETIVVVENLLGTLCFFKISSLETMRQSAAVAFDAWLAVGVGRQ